MAMRALQREGGPERAIHLCIGMAYGFSVFWLPLSHAIGIDHQVACPDMSLIQRRISNVFLNVCFPA